MAAEDVADLIALQHFQFGAARDFGGAGATGSALASRAVIGGPEKRRFDSRLLRSRGGQGGCDIRARKDQRPCQRHQTSRTGQTAARLTTRRFTETESACLL